VSGFYDTYPSRTRPLTVGVVGLGAIGRRVCQALDAGLPGVRLAAATARDRERAETFLKSLRTPAPFLSLDDLVAAAEVVVEASTQAHASGRSRRRPLGAGAIWWCCRAARCSGAPTGRAWPSARAAGSWCRRAAIAGLDGVRAGAIGP